MKETKIVPLTKISFLDFNLNSIYAQRQVWVNGALFIREKPRHSSGLIFLSGCTGVYTDLISGDSFFAPCKSLVYLPYNSRYSVLNIDSKIHKPDAYLVEFNMLLENDSFSLSDKPFIINAQNSFYIEKAMREIVECYESSPLCYSLLKSKVFNILVQISLKNNLDKSKIYNIISPALEYINKSPYDAISVEEYAKMCGLSAGGFRRLFKQYMGKSPRKHLIDIKLSAAKSLLEESDLTVEEISKILNFESTSYFCRLFKERIGATPSEFRKIQRDKTKKKT